MARHMDKRGFTLAEAVIVADIAPVDVEREYDFPNLN